MGYLIQLWPPHNVLKLGTQPEARGTKGRASKSKANLCLVSLHHETSLAAAIVPLGSFSRIVSREGGWFIFFKTNTAAIGQTILQQLALGLRMQLALR